MKTTQAEVNDAGRKARFWGRVVRVLLTAVVLLCGGTPAMWMYEMYDE